MNEQERLKEEEDLHLMFLSDNPDDFLENQSRSPEEFLNETVPSGRLITIFLDPHGQVTGTYEKTFDDDGIISIILRSKVNRGVTICLPVSDIKKWFYMDYYFN